MVARSTMIPPASPIADGLTSGGFYAANCSAAAETVWALVSDCSDAAATACESDDKVVANTVNPRAATSTPLVAVGNRLHRFGCLVFDGLRHFKHGAALGLGGVFSRLALVLAQLRVLDRAGFEDLHGLCHLTDFVFPRGGRYLGIQIALSQPLHNWRHADDRPYDPQRNAKDTQGDNRSEERRVGKEC